jgi:GTP-binding protein
VGADRVLVPLVDAAPLDGTGPVENYRTIRADDREIFPLAGRRPELLVLTKMDVTGAEEAARKITETLCRSALSISAVTGKGLPPDRTHRRDAGRNGGGSRPGGVRPTAEFPPRPRPTA